MSAEWIKTAKVGDKVVCIEGCTSFALYENHVYEITEIGTGMMGHGMISVAGTVGGIDTIPHWFATRFRPVHPRKTDIAWAYELLNNVPAKQPESEVA